MKTRTWPYGAQKTVRFEGAQKFERHDCLAFVDEEIEEAFLLVGGDNLVVPQQGRYYVIEFTRGGPTGGYWRVIRETPKP